MKSIVLPKYFIHAAPNASLCLKTGKTMYEWKIFERNQEDWTYWTVEIHRAYDLDALEDIVKSRLDELNN